MLIANVKSNADLVGKKKLQGDLLELAVANESEQERRVKDYKNPNKPVPVAPEYKSNAQLQKDRLAQERQAIANMEEFGFDYNKSAELVSWLSSSLINRLIEFNANFRGIKKELSEKTNPKLLNIDYLKNYLENYFQDLDVNYGRKFGQREINGMTMPNTVDDLTALLPTPSSIDDIIDTLRENFTGLIQLRGQAQTKKYIDMNGSPNGTESGLLDLENMLTTEGITELEKKAIKQQIGELKKDVARQDVIISKMTNAMKGVAVVRELFFLFSKIVPSPEILSVMKQSLTQQERADLLRRYTNELNKMRILTRSGADELQTELFRIISEEDMSKWVRKATASLSFITNEKNIDAINKLQRDIEYVITHSGKVSDVGNIKALNDIREKDIEEARKAYSLAGQINYDDEGNVNFVGRNPVFFNRQSLTPTPFGRARAEELSMEVETDNQLALEREEVRKAGANLNRGITPLGKRTGITKEQARERASQLAQREIIEKTRKSVLGNVKKDKRALKETPTRDVADLEYPPTVLETQIEEGGRNRAAFVKKENPALTRRKALQLEGDYKIFQERAIDELVDIYRENKRAGVDTARDYLIEYGFDKSDPILKTNNMTKGYFGELLIKIDEVMTEQRITTIEGMIQRGEDIGDYDYVANAVRARNALTGRPTTYGIGMGAKKKKMGLPEKVIKHLKEDDEENKALSKAFKKHMKIEDEVNGGALKFKHKKIKVGKGISVEAQPAYKTFGKYIIHMGHLLDKNVANFKYPSMGSIPAIKPLTITDDYKDFILDTLENGKPNERIFSKLPDEEQKHFERVISGAGLLEVFKLRRNKSDTEKKESERFNILRGEVMAGNNADKVIKELRGLILRFMNDGRIQQKEGTAMLLELSAI
jgi:hypothetical protein